MKINGKPHNGAFKAGCFLALRRTFRDGDRIELELPMEVRRQSAYGGGAWFERGPLVYAYAIPALWEKDTKRYANMNGKYPADDEAFPCWSITPAGPWNYAVSEDAVAEFVRTPDGPRMRLAAVPVDWQLFEGPGGALMTPPLPEQPSVVGESQTIELMPYGLTELRLTVFPVVK